ncbi:MAG: hypothetical protein ABJE95_39395, partial [Byssovorax sp.]
HEDDQARFAGLRLQRVRLKARQEAATRADLPSFPLSSPAPTGLRRPRAVAGRTTGVAAPGSGLEGDNALKVRGKPP